MNIEQIKKALEALEEDNRNKVLAKIEKLLIEAQTEPGPGPDDEDPG